MNACLRNGVTEEIFGITTRVSKTEVYQTLVTHSNPLKQLGRDQISVIFTGRRPVLGRRPGRLRP